MGTPEDVESTEVDASVEAREEDGPRTLETDPLGSEPRLRSPSLLRVRRSRPLSNDLLLTIPDVQTQGGLGTQPWGWGLPYRTPPSRKPFTAPVPHRGTLSESQEDSSLWPSLM